MKHPDQGGSYVRQKNGSLKRVEHTETAPISKKTGDQEPDTKSKTSVKGEDNG